MRLEEMLERSQREEHQGADSETKLDGLLSLKSSECSYSTSDEDSFSSVGSWTNFALPMNMEDQDQEYYLLCGGIDVLVASVKEGFNEIYDVFFPPLFNVVQSGNDKKTKLTQSQEQNK
eukprot:scaffold19352_cov80-Skeletonema_marinoi.AAC.2